MGDVARAAVCSGATGAQERSGAALGAREAWYCCCNVEQLRLGRSAAQHMHHACEVVPVQ